MVKINLVIDGNERTMTIIDKNIHYVQPNPVPLKFRDFYRIWA